MVVSGNPGTGKSALSQSLKPLISREESTSFFLSGKFEETNHNARGPFDVFEFAFSSYIQQLFDMDDKHLIEAVKEKVKSSIRRDRKILIQAIPALEQIFLGSRRNSFGSAASTKSDGSLRPQFYGSESAYRLRSAFSRAAAAICSVTPLVLFLDDIHYADAAALDLLRGLMQCQQSMPLLLVACKRSQESLTEELPITELSTMQSSPTLGAMPVSSAAVSRGKLLQTALKEFETDESVRLTYIHLSNMDMDSVSDLLADVLHKEPLELEELCSLAYSQTQGNVFHLFQLLRHLTDQGLITRTNEDWTWDDHQVEQELSSTGSLSDVVACTIKSLSVEVQEALKVASCMGSELDLWAIDTALLSPSRSLLEMATNKGLLTYSPQSGRYYFSNDWIRHAAYKLIPTDELAGYHLKLGQRLWQSSSLSALNHNIMLIVSLINVSACLVKDPCKRYELAKLNLKAARKALKLPSFPDAARFLRNGIEYLGENCWIDHYQLSLDLHSYTAEIETINGNFDIVSSSIDQIVRHGNSLDDKIPAYAALLTSMEQQDDLEKATSVCVDIVGKLGEYLPSRASKLTVLKEFLKVRFALRNKSDKEILAIPKMKDNHKRQCMEFLALGYLAAWRSKSPMSTLFALRAVLLSLQHGIHTASSLAFAVYAATLCGLHIDAKEGYRFGQLALKMAERSNSPRFVSYVYMIIGGASTHWTRPVAQAIEYCQHGKVVGMDSGHVGPGCQAWLMENLYDLVTGKKLSSVKKNAKALLKQARLYRQRGTEISISLVLQLINCYEGAAKDASRPTGTVLDYDKSLLESKAANDRVGVIQHYFFAMELSYMHGDIHEAARMAQLLKTENTGSSPTLTGAALQFIHALVALSQWKAGNNTSKNRKLARKIINNFVQWSKESPENFEHIKYLLEAEMKILTAGSDEKSIKLLYALAYTGAEKQGNFMVRALSHEKLGCYLDARGRKKEALIHWNKSADLYEEWGAIAKSEMIRDNIDDNFKTEPLTIWVRHDRQSSSAVGKSLSRLNGQ